MYSPLHIGDKLRDSLMRIFCFVCLPFVLYFLYLDGRYHFYVNDYKKTQKQEIRAVKEKASLTIARLRTFAEVLRNTIHSSPEDYLNIQATLRAGLHLSQHYSIPTIKNISYYKLSNPKEAITSTLITPLHSVPVAFRKPVKELESVVHENNEMIGTVPVLDQSKRLKGVLEIKLPLVDLQNFIGADKVTTLAFPPLFDGQGKQIVQNNPLDFSLKSPLPWYEYIKSHESHFWMLAYAVFIGSILLFLSNLIVKKRAGLFFGHQMDQLRKELDSQSSRGSSLEGYSSLQRQIILRFKEITRAIYQSIERIGQSYNGFPLNSHEKQVLIKGAAELAEDLSSGVCSNHQREPIVFGELLDQVKLHFTQKIWDLNLKFETTGPQNLTFTGDPLFIKITLINIIGYPLYSMPKNGKLLISTTKENGFLHLEMKDNRFSLTGSLKKHLKLPEFFIETEKLRQICTQNKVGYESFETTTGDFYTKVSFPMDPDRIYENNVIPLAR